MFCLSLFQDKKIRKSFEGKKMKDKTFLKITKMICISTLICLVIIGIVVISLSNNPILIQFGIDEESLTKMDEISLNLENYNNDLEVTQACEYGCVIGNGAEYNDSAYDYPKEVNDKIMPCIFRCNDEFYFKEE